MRLHSDLHRHRNHRVEVPVDVHVVAVVHIHLVVAYCGTVDRLDVVSFRNSWPRHYTLNFPECSGASEAVTTRVVPIWERTSNHLGSVNYSHTVFVTNL